MVKQRNLTERIKDTIYDHANIFKMFYGIIHLLCTKYQKTEVFGWCTRSVLKLYATNKSFNLKKCLNYFLLSFVESEKEFHFVRNWFETDIGHYLRKNATISI